MQQGMREGESALLERQLTRRFGPPSAETLARLKAATVEQLEQWAETSWTPPCWKMSSRTT